MRVAESVHTREQHNTWSDKGREKQTGASNAHRRQCAERRSSAREGATALDRDQTDSPFCTMLKKIYHLS